MSYILPNYLSLGNWIELWLSQPLSLALQNVITNYSLSLSACGGWIPTKRSSSGDTTSAWIPIDNKNKEKMMPQQQSCQIQILKANFLATGPGANKETDEKCLSNA
jgi:hypothetical protein